jgi:hypothetical protein
MDLNDDQVKDEIERIAPKLIPAITRDIADNGNAISEKIDDEFGSDAAQQAMTLLLVSSLSRALGGRIGLSDSEIVEFLAAPNRKPDEFLNAITKLREQSWYLHREEKRFFIKETENLSRQIERNAREIPQPKIDQALINRLQGILSPRRKNAYQEVQILPKLDEIKLSGPRVLLVIKPDGKIPPSEIHNFFQHQQEKNNLLILTGQDSHLADAVEDRLRELYAIEQIHKRQKPGDTLYEDARDRLEEAEGRFSKALSAGYNCIYFPVKEGELLNEYTLAKVIIDAGLQNGEDDRSAEAQIEKLLASPSANYKLALDFQNNYTEYFSMAEQFLWPGGKDNRRTPWKDVTTRAKCNPEWDWIPGTSGMDTLKSEALKQGRWRIGEDGYVEKGPFPKEKATVNVTSLGIQPESGESMLSLTPRHAGESPSIYYSTQSNVSESDEKVEDFENFTTKAGTLYFLVKDSSGEHESDTPYRWLADLKIRHQISPSADKRLVTLQSTPDAELRYTLDGSNPKDGHIYESPFEVGSQAARLLVFAISGEANKTADFQIPASSDKTVQINDAKPAQLVNDKRISLDTTDKVYGVINQFKEQSETLFKGVRIEIGEGEKTVSVRFEARQITASVIESTVNSLRDILKEDQSPVFITIRDGIDFQSGFDAKKFAEIAGVELRPGDIVQEA